MHAVAHALGLGPLSTLVILASLPCTISVVACQHKQAQQSGSTGSHRQVHLRRSHSHSILTVHVLMELVECDHGPTSALAVECLENFVELAVLVHRRYNRAG
jgi:hypothetical protein